MHLLFSNSQPQITSFLPSIQIIFLDNKLQRKAVCHCQVTFGQYHPAMSLLKWLCDTDRRRNEYPCVCIVYSVLVSVRGMLGGRVIDADWMTLCALWHFYPHFKGLFLALFRPAFNPSLWCTVNVKSRHNYTLSVWTVSMTY